MEPSRSVKDRYPTTPDHRYFVVRGRLWRCSNPALPASVHDDLVHTLMDGRRAVKAARQGDGDLQTARHRVDEAKHALGERGAVWWSDGAPDYNRTMVRNTPYADWYDETHPQTT